MNDDRKPPSEYGGRGTNRNTITRGATPSASDRLRLTYLTGQSHDPDAPRSPGAWEGLSE